jgi:nicotinamide-nucleotide amidase
MLRFVGLGQSQIDQTLEDNVPLAPDITVTSQFDGSRVDFTFSLPEDTPQERAKLQELKQKIMQHLGEYVYADDETSLEEHVLKLLKARGETLALAEAGSGGTLAAALSSADGDEQVLAGAYIAPTMKKLFRLLAMDNSDSISNISEEQKIKKLAIAVAHVTASQWVIVVSEIMRDDSGSGCVEVAFKMPDDSIENQKVRIHGNGELARSRLSTQLIEKLRRKLK